MSSFDSAQSFYQQGFFHLAQPLLWNQIQAQASSPFSEEDSEEFLESISQLLRICAEREDSTAAKNLWSLLASQPELLEKLNQSSRFLYQRSLQTFFEGHLEAALLESQKTLELALSSGSHRDLAYALVLKIKLEMAANKNPNGPNSDLEKLRIFLDVLKNSDLNLTYFLLESEIAIKNQQLDLALEKIWSAYETAKLTGCGMFNMASTIAMLGYVSVLRGEHKKALEYLEMAEKACIPESFIRLLRIIQGLRVQCRSVVPAYDLFLDLKNRQLLLSDESQLPLGNQFTIMKLLELLFKNPGQTFSKEELTRLVWEKNYDPATHDNLIYVTLKRVRGMIKDDSRGISFLQRNRSGYYLNPEAKIGIAEAELS